MIKIKKPKPITINLTNTILRKIAKLVEEDEFPSRSELIRQAIRKILPRLVKIFKEFNEIEDNEYYTNKSICSVSIPQEWTDTIDSISSNLMGDGLVPSRSEMIRLMTLLYLMEHEPKNVEINEVIEVVKEVEEKFDDKKFVKVPNDDINGEFKMFKLVKK